MSRSGVRDNGPAPCPRGAADTPSPGDLASYVQQLADDWRRRGRTDLTSSRDGGNSGNCTATFVVMSVDGATRTTTVDRIVEHLRRLGWPLQLSSSHYSGCRDEIPRGSTVKYILQTTWSVPARPRCATPTTSRPDSATTTKPAATARPRCSSVHHQRTHCRLPVRRSAACSAGDVHLAEPADGRHIGPASHPRLLGARQVKDGEALPIPRPRRRPTVA